MKRWTMKAGLGLPFLLLSGALAAQQASAPAPAAAPEAPPSVWTTAPAGATDGAVTPASAVEDAPPAAAGPMTTPEFNRRLLTNEEEVNRIKERVFRSKATLQLLQEVVLQGTSTGAHAVLWHESELGPSYTIESIHYFLDGQSIFSKAMVSSTDASQHEFKIHEGAIPAGNHLVTLSMVLRGNGFGVFSYVDRYTFNVQSSYAFSIDDGKSCQVWIRTKERKGVGRSFVERPMVEYEMSCNRLDQTR
jgi:hypothetical protein